MPTPFETTRNPSTESSAYVPFMGALDEVSSVLISSADLTMQRAFSLESSGRLLAHHEVERRPRCAFA